MMVKLSVEIDPPSRNPPLLLLHGMLSSRNQWLANAGLSLHFRLIRAELPGHGNSPTPDSADDLRAEVLVQALDSLRRELSITQWYLCGQSFGAALTLRYALTFPEHTIAQAFTNTLTAFRPTSSVEHVASGVTSFFEGNKAPKSVRRFPFHPIYATRLPQEYRAKLVEDADGVSVQTVTNLFRHTYPDISIRESFNLTKAPTLLINGKKETAFQPVRDFVTTSLPLGHVIDLDGGHAINIEQSEGFDDAIASFFGAHPPRAAG
jgi:pimeloyl-ACP methyl ester carboxylesterase